MTVKNRITGEMAQLVTCQLEPDQTVYSEANKYRWKTVNVSLETRLTTPGGQADQQHKSGGFLSGALAAATEVAKRAVAGQGAAFQWFKPSGGSGLVSFAGDQPGQIRAIELDGSVGWFVERRGFICAESTVSFDIAFNGLRQGRSSGEGMILEKFTGDGTLVVAGGGTILEVNPSDYGGKIQAHAGALVAFADSITYGVELVGAMNAQLLMTAVFGGHSVTVVTLEGNGPVLLQSVLHRAVDAEEQQQSQERHERGVGGLLDRL